MRRLTQIAVWVLAVLATTLVIAIATSGAADPDVPLAEDSGLPVRLPQTPGKPAPPDPGAADAARAPTGRQLASPADLEAALTLAKNDAVLRSIVGSTKFRVVASVPWLAAELKPLGTKLTLELDAPISGDFRLPAADFNPSGNSYRRVFADVTIRDAARLDVLIDLESRRIASVMPPPSTVTLQQGATSQGG